MLTDKQKEAREQALGSSDAPIVAGVSPYKAPLELYYQLEGSLPRYTDDETRAQHIGSKLEPVIGDLVAEEVGIKIRRSATRRHPVHAFMVANLDFEIISNPKGPGVLEIKNRMGTKPFDMLPDDITLQVVHQMAVTQREWALVGVLFGFGVLKTYEVPRDKELEEYLIELEARFMLRVQKKEPPAHDWTPETVGILKKLYPTDSGKLIQLTDPNTQEALDHFTDGKRHIEEGEEMKARGEGWLKNMMQDATNAEWPGYKLSWKSTKASTKFDVDKFKEENPDLYNQYLKTVPGHRVFRVTPSKELA